MSLVKGFDLKKWFEKVTSRLPTTPHTRPSLSVNSLSQVSDRLAKLGRGESIKKMSFAVCLLLCSFFIADLLALLFEKYLPAPPVSVLASRVSGGMMSARPSDYDVIPSRNLFSSRPAKKGASDEIDLNAEPIASTLPFQLIGTVIFQNPAKSMATIQDKNESKVYPVRPGDEIDEKAQILSVEPRRVIFINMLSHRKEFIELPDDPSFKISAASHASATANIAQVDDNKFVVKRAEIDNQMANMNALLTQARAVPEMCGGQMVGFKLMQIQPGSFYEKIGLKEGCTIKGVNGEKITDAAKALSLLGELKHMNSLDLTVTCGGCDGKEKVMNYDIQ